MPDRTAVAIDRLLRSSRRTVGLAVTREGLLVVRAPRRLSEAEVRRLVESKSEWIRRTQARIRERLVERPAHQYLEGESFPVLGEPCALRIEAGARPGLSFDGSFRLAPEGVPRARRLFEAWYRRYAARTFAERVAHWGGRLGVRPARVVVSSARAKWGSCDGRAVVRLAWRLVMAPLPVIDYLVIHELAHLIVRGHARDFWDLVAVHDPGYRAHRRWLADHGHTLEL